MKKVTVIPLCLAAWALLPLLGAGHLFGEEKLILTTRSRVEAEEGTGRYRVVYKRQEWNPGETAIIICDMWNQHWCKGATRRVAEMAPIMNEVVSRARRRGVMIVHAPSGTMAHYKNHPARRRAMDAPRASDLPQGISGWCNNIPPEAGGTWPIDQSDGGCDCEPRCKGGNPWRSQIDTIQIHDEDAITDSGAEVWNLFSRGGIKNVILMGVHTNMCVIGRPFGLRNMARFGKNVVLMRDMTDTMYNSRKPPRVVHFTGTDLIIEYIEKYVCPTVTSSILTGRDPFRFQNDRRPRVVFLSAESEYGASETLPELAHLLELHGGLYGEILQGSTEKRGPDRNYIPGMRALSGADLAVLFVRRRALPPGDMKIFRDYLARGKPLIAFRTSSHGFQVRGEVPPGLEDWKDFDRQVLGGKYNGYPHGATRVRVAPESAAHPILKGLEGPYLLNETMYRHLPLSPSTRVLLMGKCVDGPGENSRYRREPGVEVPDQPVAWVNTYRGGRIFYTLLGSSRASFREPWFRRMVVNAVYWALDRPIPEDVVKSVRP